MATRRRREPKPWTALTKATWSLGLGVAGIVIVACAVLAIVLGYLAWRDAESEGTPRAASRGKLGMALGAIGLVTSFGWMLAVGGAF